MINEGLSSATLSGYATMARSLASAIGKQNIVPRTNIELGFSGAGSRYKPQIANMSGQDTVKAELYARDRYLGLAHEMRNAFGLRAKESLLSVKTSVRSEHTFLLVRGAKSGRNREVEVRTAYQRKIIGKVREHLKETGGKSLVPPDKTLKQAYDRQRNALTLVGASNR